MIKYLIPVLLIGYTMLAKANDTNPQLLEKDIQAMIRRMEEYDKESFKSLSYHQWREEIKTKMRTLPTKIIKGVYVGADEIFIECHKKGPARLLFMDEENRSMAIYFLLTKEPFPHPASPTTPMYLEAEAKVEVETENRYKNKTYFYVTKLLKYSVDESVINSCVNAT